MEIEIEIEFATSIGNPDLIPTVNIEKSIANAVIPVTKNFKYYTVKNVFLTFCTIPI